MSAVTVAVVGPEEALSLAKELGKGTAEGDLGRHFLRVGDRFVNLLSPTKYPERVQGVSQALLVAQRVVLVVPRVDRDLGVLILALEAAGIREGLVVLQGDLVPEMLAPLVKDSGVASWPMLAGEEARTALVRERLGDLSTLEREGATRVAVEQAFPVRGVGTVVLGAVTQGEVKRHQVLKAHPSGSSATVRSIKVHDADVEKALVGDRVGLALRGVEADVFSRGDVLGEEGSSLTHAAAKPFSLELQVPRFHPKGLEPGRSYHLGIGFQIVPVEVVSEEPVPAGGKALVQVRSSSAVAVEPGARVLLWDLEHPSLRLVAGGVCASGTGA
jgi:selenocysteine-specific translation elongation factor